MKKIYLFFFALAFFQYTTAQQFTSWKNYTNMQNVQAVKSFSGGVWAATKGGAFLFSAATQNYTTLLKADGLNSISQTAVTIDNSGRVWFGNLNGVLDIYNPADKSINVILDIFNSNQTNKKINELTSSGDTIIVSSDFGVSLIDAVNFLFFDTFFKFGNFPSNSRVNSTTKLDLIYICTDEGVAIQKPEAVNLSAPESWNVYTTSEGLPSNKTIKIVSYLGDIIAATDEGIALLNDTIWVNFIAQFNGKSVEDLQVSGDSLLILSENKIYLFTSNQLTELYSTTAEAIRLSYNPQFGITAATSSGVLHLDNNLADSYLLPNGPAANQFPSLSTDGNGILYSASGKDGTGVGFYSLNGERWTNFNASNTPGLPSNDVYHIYNSPDNSVYLGTWGRGFAELKAGKLNVFNSANSGMQGIPENPDFLVITGFGNDTRNNLWVLNFWAGDGKSLSLLTTDSTWYHFAIPAAQNRILLGQDNLAIDQFDTKWISSSDPGKPGLFYFNENKTFDDFSDDRSGFISTADGLNSNDIRDVAIDRRGDVWIGTTVGVNVLTNTSAIPSSNDPTLRLSSVFTLREQSINAIIVDPLNQKWVGTNEGLLLVNSDGSRLITALTSKNSPLLSDRIQSLAFDENGGILYVGTEEGLTSFETPFIKPLESFDKLFVFPNPFRIKDNTKLLTIDGLIRDTDIKILTINGSLVSEFSSPGGRTAYWDGTDLNGNFVSSGVYIIVAFDKDGNNVTTGKVAVFRE